MKVIGNMKELLCLDCDLVMFILSSCPWIAEEWEPENVGFIFLLDDRDINEVSSICTVPHVEESDYRTAMTIDLATFDLWETPSFLDDTAGYWNVVAILALQRHMKITTCGHFFIRCDK